MRFLLFVFGVAFAILAGTSTSNATQKNVCHLFFAVGRLNGTRTVLQARNPRTISCGRERTFTPERMDSRSLLTCWFLRASVVEKVPLALAIVLQRDWLLVDGRTSLIAR